MTKRKPLPDVEYLRSLFDYEPDTGHLRWKVDRAQMKAGDIAGHLGKKDGRYVRVSVDMSVYRGHLIIWKMVTGQEPVGQIDHKNLIKNDNRWVNLREATKAQNKANTALMATNTTGAKCVFWYKAYGKWVVQVWKDKKAHFGGYFESFEDATASAKVLRLELYGEFEREL